MTHRVAIVGAGNISDTHARAALEIPGVEVAAVYGRNAGKARALAARHGGTAYESLEAALEHPGVDVALIGSPTGMHAEQAREAVRRGIHVMVEKPLDISTERIDALAEEVDRAGVRLGVFYQDRASRDLAWLKELLDGGGIGRPLLCTARLKWYRPPEYYSGSRWRGTPEMDGGGALINQGSHTVDLLLWLMGDVRSVSALTRTVLHEIEVDDTALATLTFASGAVGTLEATTAAYPGYPRRVEITGTEGTVIVEGDRVTAVDLRTPPATPPPGGGTANAAASSATVSDVGGHRELLAEFLHAVETGGTPRCDAREARRSVELIQAIYRSAREEATVRL